MGEYALYKNREIKIGTCEDMYYLRADQVKHITAIPGSVNPKNVTEAGQIRFRFPFPQEDGIEPGAFEAFYGLGVNCEAPPDIEHHTIQFSASGRGLLISLPCPESPEGAAHKTLYKVHYNGYSVKTKISQQRLIDGELVLVCECGSCGAKYRLPTLEHCRPVLDALRKLAASEQSRASYYNEVAERIIAGYSADNFWSEQLVTA